MEKGGAHEAPSLADELLAVVALGGRRIIFSMMCLLVNCPYSSKYNSTPMLMKATLIKPGRSVKNKPRGGLLRRRGYRLRYMHV